MAQDNCAVTHVMLDLETLGTKPGCSIASIGAVSFDPIAGSIGAKFLARISLQSCDDAGLHMDAKTVHWWMQQSEKARANTFFGERTTLERAIFAFGGWWHDNAGPDTKLWAHGATFDPGIMEAAYLAIGEAVPWKFNLVRDTRTIFDVSGVDVNIYRDPDSHHSALKDAEAQAHAVIAAYEKLGLRGGSNVQ